MLNWMVEHQPDNLDLDTIFHALSHPICRATLEELADGPKSAAFEWLTRYRVLWEDRFDALADHLEEDKE